MAVVDVKYNSNDFQTTVAAASTILTKDILYRQIAEKTLNLKEDSIRDGFSLIDVRYFDTVKGYLRPNDKNLDIETYGGSGAYRRYKASCQSFTVPEEHWMSTQVPYEATFLAEPYGTATSTSTLDLNSGGNIVATPYNEAIVFTGSYNPKPVITITVVAETNLTALRFDNVTTSDWIQVARSFAAAEVLTIDCDAETVMVGTIPVDFTGVFPSFTPGSNSVRLTTTDSGAFQVTVSVVYYTTYL